MRVATSLVVVRFSVRKHINLVIDPISNQIVRTDVSCFPPLLDCPGAVICCLQAWISNRAAEIRSVGPVRCNLLNDVIDRCTKPALFRMGSNRCRSDVKLRHAVDDLWGRMFEMVIPAILVELVLRRPDARERLGLFHDGGLNGKIVLLKKTEHAVTN